MSKHVLRAVALAAASLPAAWAVAASLSLDDAVDLGGLGSSGAQRDDRVGQAATEWGRRMVHARRYFVVACSRLLPIGLQIIQRLDEHLVTDALDRSLQFAAASRRKNQGHEQAIRGPLRSRHQDPGRQAGYDPRVHRHAGHGVGRTDGRVGAGMAKPHRSGLAGRLATPRLGGFGRMALATMWDR